MKFAIKIKLALMLNMNYNQLRQTTEDNMTLNEIVAKIPKGQIFSARFVKKDGTIRDMVARLGVTKHLQGGELKYDAKAMNLLPVFDMQKSEYRMINISTLIQIKINGEVIKF